MFSLGTAGGYSWGDMARIILKILAGQQAGAEVMLEPGEYTLGSGREDDLQLSDLSVAEKHLLVKLQDNKIEVSAQKGDVRSENGIDLKAGQNDDWVEIEPLDILSIGTVKIALAAKNAQWSTLNNALNPKEDEGDSQAKAQKPVAFPIDSAVEWAKARQKRLAAALVVTTMVGAGALLIGSGNIAPRTANALATGGIEEVRIALNDLPFAQTLDLRQDVDDQIYLSGYVEAPVERRAIVDAVERTAVPVKMRLRVLESLENDVQAYLNSRESNVRFQISNTGELTLTGSILSPEEANQIVADLRAVNGIAKVTSKIRTADDYLSGVRGLAKRALIDDTILLRLDENTLEVSGIVASQDLDRWSGFLRSYSRQYAPYIPMRSLVKLVQEDGQLVDLKASVDGVDVNTGQLVDPQSVATSEAIEERQTKVIELARAIKKEERQGRKPTSDAGESSKPAKKADRFTELEEATQQLLLPPPPAPQPVASDETENKPEPETVAASEEPKPVVITPPQVDEKWLGTNGVVKIGAWDALRNDPVRAKAAEMVFHTWVDVAGVEEEEEPKFRQRFLPMLVTPRSVGPACSEELSVPLSQITVTVFWLDILSGSEKLDLEAFPEDQQRILLEAAINPGEARKCLRQAEQAIGIDLVSYSNFMRETDRNPDIVRFLTRNLLQPSVKVSGVSLLNDRYIQSDLNERYTIGQSTSNSSRLIAIGELGALIREYEGYSVALYKDSAAWILGRKEKLL